jgi:hypothetical protein
MAAAVNVHWETRQRQLAGGAGPMLAGFGVPMIPEPCVALPAVAGVPRPAAAMPILRGGRVQGSLGAFAVIAASPAPVLGGPLAGAGPGAMMLAVHQLLREIFPGVGHTQGLRHMCLCVRPDAAATPLLWPPPPSAWAVGAVAPPGAAPIAPFPFTICCVGYVLVDRGENAATSAIDIAAADGLTQGGWAVAAPGPPPPLADGTVRGRRVRRERVDLGAVPGWGAGAQLRMLSIGPQGSGHRVSCCGASEGWGATLAANLRFAGPLDGVARVLSNVDVTYMMCRRTRALERLAQRTADGAVQAPHQQPVRRRMDDEAIAAAEAKVRERDASAYESFEEWLGPGIRHLKAYSESFYLQTRSRWMDSMRHEFVAAIPAGDPEVPPVLHDFEENAAAYQNGVLVETQGPVLNRRVLVISGATSVGKSTLLHQMASPEYAAAHGATFQGFMKITPRELSAVGFKDLVHMASKIYPRRRGILALQLELGSADDPLVMSNDAYARLAELTDVCSPQTSFKYEGGVIQMTQHVVVICNKPCRRVLSQLCHKEVWMLDLSEDALTAPMAWHFPGQPPSRRPSRGACGSVTWPRGRPDPATGELRGSPFEGLEAWIAASLPAHLPGVQGPLGVADAQLARDAFLCGMLHAAGARSTPY